MNEMTPVAAGKVDAATLAQRARAIGGEVTARAAEAESLRRLPDQTVRDFEAAGLCKVWIPRRFGGDELDLHAGLETMFEVARGCASSAWCLTVWQQHSWIVAHFPEAAQAETLGADPDFHVGAVLAPRGTLTPVEGGFVLDGVWPFASGCEHGSWILLGGQVVDGEGRPETLDREIFGNPAMHARLSLIPIGEVEIKGDWNVAGLCGTGSHSIAVDKLFVPEHRTLVIPDAVEGRSPGAGLHDGTIFRATYYSFLHTALCGPAPGVAQGMLDHLLAMAPKKMVAPMNRPQVELVRTHRQVAEAESKIQMARLLLRDAADRIMAAAREGHLLNADERALCRRNGALSTHLSYEAGEIVFFAAGGSQLSLKSPLQRMMRDLHAIKAHYFMDLETAYELSGMTRLGVDPYTYVF